MKQIDPTKMQLGKKRLFYLFCRFLRNNKMLYYFVFQHKNLTGQVFLERNSLFENDRTSQKHGYKKLLTIIWLH